MPTVPIAMGTGRDEFSLEPNDLLNLRLVDSRLIPRDASHHFGEVVPGFVRGDALVIPLIRSKQVLPKIPRNSVGSCAFDEMPKDCADWASVPRELPLGTDGEDDYLVAISAESGFGDPVYDLDEESFGFSRTGIAVVVDVVVGTRDRRASFQGLLLENVDEEHDDMYERIGYFYIEGVDVNRVQQWTRKTLTME